MMRRFWIILTALLAVACATEETPVAPVSLDVTMEEPATKVGLDGLEAVWTEGDDVSVFWTEGLSEQWVYQGEDRSRSGKIVAQVASLYTDDTSKFALLPYSSEAILSGKTLSCVLPSEQTYSDGKLPAVLMTAASKTDVLSFKYACGYVCVNLGDAYSLTSAVLSGRASETVAGPVSMDMDEYYPCARLSEEASEKSITVSASEGSFRTGELWFCLPEMEFTDGLSVTLNLQNGGTREVLFDGPLDVKRAHVLQLGIASGRVELLLDFRSGNNPFTAEFPTGQNGKYTEEEGYAFFTIEGGYEFRFHTPESTSAYGVGYRGSTYDYVMIGRNDSWIQFPAIEGYALRSVRFESGTTSSTPKPYLSAAGDRADHVSNIAKDLVEGQEFALWVSAQKNSCPYWLNVTSGNFCFRYLKCTYEKL